VLCLYLRGSQDHHHELDSLNGLEQRISDADNLMQGKKGRTVGVGSIVGGESAFESMPPVETPTLVLPGGEAQDASALLKYDMSESGNGTITYNVHLSDLEGDEIPLSGESTLCFPYPEGLDQNSARKYRIIIHHQISDKKTEVFKSEDGEIEFAPQGLCIRIKSFSPFEISWGVFGDVLPGTGDASLPLSFLLLLLGASLLGFGFAARHKKTSRA